MADQLGMLGQGVAVSKPYVSATGTKPRIGADRFRALSDRLKKPQIFLADTPELVSEPDSQIEAADEPDYLPTVAVPEPEGLPAEFSSTVAFPYNSENPALRLEHEARVAAEPISIPQVVDDLAATLPAAERIVPAVVAEPVTQATIPTPVTGESEPAQRKTLSRLERVLAGGRKLDALHMRLPEILPPPRAPEPEAATDAAPAPLAPSMEEVQERLRGDATVRLQQLDIENIWRQVLANPTLEERADYLREAAAIMAAEQGDAPAEALPAEHDLSLIEHEVVEETLPVESANAAPAVSRSSAETSEQLETAELARSLLDMMSSGSNSGLPHERALASDTLLRLLPKLATKTLQMMAQRLALMDNPPQLLVAKLIRDSRVEVSGPLLEDCMHITDHDLAMVLEEENPGKRRMIARRRKLSRAISDRLIAIGDGSVLLSLVRNANAEISHDGFIGLITAAGKNSDLLAPLSTRADLSAPNAFLLFWTAPTQLRRYLLHRFLTDSETLTKILKITLTSGDGEEGRDPGLPSAGEVTELLHMAARGRVDAAAQQLGEALNVDVGVIHRILADRLGDAMIVMLKAAGYPRGSVGDILLALTRGETPLLDSERELEELQTMFDTLSINKARILITYWDWAARKSGPYAPVH
jgi:uncharacterized protein (DUF2336 family)